MNAKDKEHNMWILVGSFLFICMDYFALLNAVYHLTGIGKGGAAFSAAAIKIAPVMRGVFILLFTFLSWNNYKNKLVSKTWLETDSARYVLLVSSIVLALIFCSINILPVHLVIYLYPIVFIMLMVSLICLIMTYNEVVLKNEEGTQLGVSKEPAESKFAFVLQAQNGYINIKSPFRSIGVFGGAGAGKSYSTAEPIIDETVRLGFSGICYDVKFPELCNKVYTSFLYHDQRNVKLYPVSFNDVTRSYRFNPLEPSLLKTTIYADQYALSLYSTLDKSMQKAGGSNYFNESAVAVLKSVIWFLKKNEPQYCTAPHVVQLILTASTEDLIKILMTDSETKGFISSVKDAADKEAYEQIAGVTGTLKNYMSKIASKEFYWVCTGNDFTLDLNNPDNPGYMVLGNALDVKSAMNPIIAMIFTIGLNLMNNPNQNPTIFLIDEGPTVQILDLESIPATGRANKLCVMYMAQDISQLDTRYGKDKTKEILSNLGSQFYGNTRELGTAKMVSELIGDEYRSISSSSKSGSSSENGDSNSNSVSYSEQKRRIIEPNSITNLEQGEFVGVLVDSDINAFRAKLKGLPDKYPDYKVKEIDPFIEDFDLTPDELQLVNNEIKKVLSDIEGHRQDREINVLYVKYQNSKETEGFSPDWLDTRLKKLIMKRSQQKKIDDLLLKNFESINADIEKMIGKYVYS